MDSDSEENTVSLGKIKPGSQSFRNSLNYYGISDQDIVSNAVKVYHLMSKPVRRKHKRTLLLLYCTYCAHLELGRPANIGRLAKLFDVSPAESKRCITMFGPHKTGYTPPPNTTSVETEIDNVCQTLSLEDSLSKKVAELYRELLEKGTELVNCDYSVLAAAMVKYYLTSRGVKIKDFSKLLNVSDNTLSSVYHLVADTDNSR